MGSNEMDVTKGDIGQGSRGVGCERRILRIRLVKWGGGEIVRDGGVRRETCSVAARSKGVEFF